MSTEPAYSRTGALPRGQRTLRCPLARRFAQSGFQVVVSGRSVEKLNAVVQSVETEGDQALAISADTGSESDTLAALEADQELGRLRVAIFTVGNSLDAPSLELSAQVFKQTWRASNFGGFLFACEANRAPARQSRRHDAVHWSDRFAARQTALRSGQRRVALAEPIVRTGNRPAQCACRPRGDRRQHQRRTPHLQW